MTNRAAQFVQLLRSTKKERRLGTVIFFVTSRCNAKCETCFYHEELNRPGDLTFEQIERVSRTMPEVTDLWLSGGEPTLRHDAVEVIRLFVENNGVRRVIIPTNGLLKARTFELVDGALSLHSDLHLYRNVALDGYGETHDRVRGVPGNWGRTLECIRALYPLKEKYGERFRLNVVRGETKAGDGIKQIPAGALPGMYARVCALTERYGGRMFAADDAATR